MIPPAESLLKYGNPILVNKNPGKKSAKVTLLLKMIYLCIISLCCIQSVSCGKKRKLIKNKSTIKNSCSCQYKKKQ